VAIGSAIVGLIAIAAPSPAIAIFLGLAVALEALRWWELRRLSPATRELLRADNRARRWRPQRWRYRWITRLRPWWWLLLVRLPPPLVLGANLALLVAAAAGRIVFWIVAFALALPFSSRRAFRWWRRRHPPASSWRPPA
jgi:hypothetical protein